MKNTSLFITVVLALTAIVSCINTDNKQQSNGQQSEQLGAMPIIKFETDAYDFGKILQGEKVSYTFKFKNIGNNELIIKNASASCGCTVPKYSEKPIAPGNEGEIEVIFDSYKRNGRQIKTITVWTNCQPEQYKLQIAAQIETPTNQ